MRDLLHSFPSYQPLAPQEASCYAYPATLMSTGSYQGLGIHSATPQQATLLLIRGREPISKSRSSFGESASYITSFFFLCRTCNLRRTLQCGEAWPLPTSRGASYLHARPVGKNVRWLQRTTWNNDRGWRKGLLASFLWGKICSN